MSKRYAVRSPALERAMARAAQMQAAADAKIHPAPPNPDLLPAKPVVAPPPTLQPDDNLEWLEEVDGLFLRQHVMPLAALVGTCFEPANRFMLAPLAKGAIIPDELTSAFLYPVRAAMEAMPQPVRAAEEGGCADRVCCPLTRGFAMDFVGPVAKDAAHDAAAAADNDAEGVRPTRTTPFFSVVRESACEPCGCWPVFFTNAQRLAIFDRRGEPIARAIEPIAVCRSCWTRTFIVVGADGQLLYTLRASDCGAQNKCNFCAPTCFNESYDVDVFGPDGEYLVSATWVWPGCACGASASDRSAVIIRFPAETSGASRAALLGGVMLVEYTSMELKRAQEGNSAVARDASYPRDDPRGMPAPAVRSMQRS